MTKICEYLPQDLPATHPRRQLRQLSPEDFIQQHASGTLRKSTRLGFNIQEAYLQERARFEFGEGFEVRPRSRVTYSDLKLTHCQALTELGWHAERMIEMRPFESDRFVCKQFELEYADGTVKEGAGILVQETSAAWIPQGHMVLAIVAEKRHGRYLAAKNPF